MTQSVALAPEAFAGHTVVVMVPIGTLQPWMAERVWDVARSVAGAGRRVALVDLSLRDPVLHRQCDVPPDQGIADVFLRDVPISEAARRQEPPTLHFLAAGESVAHPGEVWGHDRWTRLASGFANEGAMLAAFVPPQALPVLNLPIDGLVLLDGDPAGSTSEHSPGLQRLVSGGVPILATLRADSLVRRPAARAPNPVERSGPSAFGTHRRAPRPRWVPTAVIGAVVLALFGWFVAGRAGRSATSTPPALGAAESDTMYYTLQVAAFNTLERAMERAIELENDDYTSTVTPVRRGAEIWYRVQIGMLPHSGAADSTLRALWESDRVERPHGTILRTPHAFDLGGFETTEAARAAAQGLRERTIPAYVLVAPDGARVLFGAFEEPDQADLAESLLAAAGLESHLVPRLGIAR